MCNKFNVKLLFFRTQGMVTELLYVADEAKLSCTAPELPTSPKPFPKVMPRHCKSYITSPKPFL